jgi:hypothetical protein
MSMRPSTKATKASDQSDPIPISADVKFGGGAAGYLYRHVRFFTLVFGVFVCFGGHNYLQEYVMALPEYRYGFLLGYLEVLGVTICTAVEKQLGPHRDAERKSPWHMYIALCACLFVSSGASNVALKWINYPTKVVFRSCKLIPTMLISVAYNKASPTVQLRRRRGSADARGLSCRRNCMRTSLSSARSSLSA